MNTRVHRRRYFALVVWSALLATSGLAPSPQADAGIPNPPTNQQTAADQPKGSLLYEFILVKVIPGQRQEYTEFLKNEYMPIQDGNEFIRSRTSYVEDAGAEWDFMVVMTYDDYTAFDKSKKRYDELLRKKFPSPADRTQFVKRFQAFVDKHQHMFYRRLPEISR